MEVRKLLTTGTLLTAMVSAPVMAADAPSAGMTPEQSQAVEKIVHDYLVNNPEVLIEASQALQVKQQQSQQKEAEGAIQSLSGQLFNPESVAIIGNPKGKVTIVEFFDYQCIHCKKMAPVISSLIKGNSDLRVIMKEFPIFGGSSEEASRAALAAGMQGKYQQMHDALFNISQPLNSKLIDQAAQSLGLNMKKFKADMASDKVKNELSANRKLAEGLHLMGTPALIVASTPDGLLDKNSKPQFIPGAASEQTLNDLIKKSNNNA